MRGTSSIANAVTCACAQGADAVQLGRRRQEAEVTPPGGAGDRVGQQRPDVQQHVDAAASTRLDDVRTGSA